MIRKFEKRDLEEAIGIWNQVVEDGVAFPQLELLEENSGEAFFASQSFTAVAQDVDSGNVLGLYILHPNNIGRCGHIANASYAVRRDCRGQGIGELLVRHSLTKAKELEFHLMQFNAVVKSNTSALALYQKLGFIILGTIPGGFRMKDGSYEDIVLLYHTLYRLT